jgi:phosphodiesterase/alkaline phosphatase D-like protein
MTRIPYLQAQGTNTITVSWHDIQDAGTKVMYSTDSTVLSFESLGSSEIISEPYRWHTVKLTGLSANTRYYYRIASGGSESGIYSFKTLPDQSYNGKIRFVLFSDTHGRKNTSGSPY